jgi:hypothetical protein
MKSKVEKLLIKHGNNPDNVKKMIDECYDYAASQYQTASKIAECIRIIY